MTFKVSWSTNNRIIHVLDNERMTKQNRHVGYTLIIEQVKLVVHVKRETLALSKFPNVLLKHVSTLGRNPKTYKMAAARNG